MTRRAALAALVLPALVLVAITARSYQPLGDDDAVGRRAPSTAFLDGVFTVIGVLAVVALVVFLWVWLRVRPTRRSGGSSTYSGLLAFLLIFGFVLVGGRALLQYDRQPANDQGSDGAFPREVQPGQPISEAEELARSPEVIWPLAIGVALLITALVVTAVILDRRRSRPAERTPEELERLLRALDDAIDDLRRDPDPRRAVVAAYARMEQALSYHGLPRRASEAPYEYLARVGRELDAEEPVAALTELFEEAKFSEHRVDEGMRSRAIDALVSVRREVQAST